MTAMKTAGAGELESKAAARTGTPKCRFCKAPLTVTFADLGVSPLANSYIKAGRERAMEPFFPLHAFVCDQCWLVQLEDYERPEAIFDDYAYFSSFSDAWLKHCERYAQTLSKRLGLGKDSLVVEVASNDGYMLQFFQKMGVPVLGVEPARTVAEAALKKGVPTEIAFFGEATAAKLKGEGHEPDLIAAKNVLAHVPDINDFVQGFKVLLKPGGAVTVEFPHLLRQIEHNQFDTIYHEHYSYLSFGAVERVFAAHGLRMFDVDELPTHGGSLRIYACHEEDEAKGESDAVVKMRELEEGFGLWDIGTYERFSEQVVATKKKVLRYFLDAADKGKRVAGYGAPAKGNTLLNYCGVGPELLPFTVDRSPHKQNTLLPGTRIPVRAPEAIIEERPDEVFILPWNLRDEISEQMKAVREWGGKFVVPIPEIEIF